MLQGSTLDDGEAPVGSDSEAGRWRSDPAGQFLSWQRSRLLGASGHSAFDDRSTRQYAAMFGRFCKWLAAEGGHVDAFQAEDVERFLSTIGGRGATAAHSTVRRYLALLEKVVDHLNEVGVRQDVAEGGGCANPARDLLRLRQYRYMERPAPVFLSQANSERYIDWVRSRPISGWVEVRDRALRLVFLACGVSVDEVRRLRISDARLDADGVTQLQIAAHRVGQHARVVPVAAWAWDALTHWCRLRRAIVAPTDALFLARSGDFKLELPGEASLGATETFLIIQEAMVAIGHTSERQGPQTLRNTFAARQLLAGVPKDRVAEWLGLQTTESVSAIERQLPERGGIRPA